MNAPLLQLHGIEKSFGAVRALGGVSFELRPGEIHALLGENGAGKSTLIRMITGAHTPDAGTITIAGEQVRNLTPDSARRLGIACVYQQPALFPGLTVAENLALRLESGSAFRRISWSARRARAAGLLGKVGARIAPESLVETLSMPAQQLVEIACALGTGARVLLLDEPTASLTRDDQARLHTLLRRLRDQGTGILYITHRLEEVFALADRVTVLRDGRSVGTHRVRGPEVESSLGNPPSPGNGASPGPEPMEGKRLDEPALIRLMVGRDVRPGRLQPGCRRGPVVLTLHRVACASTGVRDVSLEVHAGEIVGLAGMVGSGRTELARILFGLDPCDSGEIRIHDRRVHLRNPRDAIQAGIACLPEDRRRHGVILEMPIAHNVTLAVHPTLFPGGWIRERAEQELTAGFLRNLGIRAPDGQTPAGALSGGNQQKVALARWLAAAPKVLILDEPTQGVDVGAKEEIHRRIRQLADDGLAVLMISSDLPEVLTLSDRIGVMRAGRMVATMPGGSDPDAVMAAALGGPTAKDPAP
ncbi:MAG: sugar ABC transporter ATP-binding protein [Verrucomicrobiae bacterium]|nr:sugar ABC transporter ATP-binding protein [Verrucomicrobiae bacterium]